MRNDGYYSAKDMKKSRMKYNVIILFTFDYTFSLAKHSIKSYTIYNQKGMMKALFIVN